MHAKKRLSAMWVALVLTLTGSFVSTPASQASGPTLTEGSLDLVSDFWNTADSNPRDFVTSGDAAYFTADTDEYGRELYRYQNETLTRFDLFPGPDDMDLETLFPIDGGIGFTIQGYGNPSNRDHVVGYLKGDEIYWIRNDDLDGDLSDDEINLTDRYAAAVNERFFIPSYTRRSLFEIDFFAQSDPVRSTINWDIVVTDGEEPEPVEFIDEIAGIWGLGDHLILDMELDSTGGFEVYAADTREEPSLFTRLVQSPPTGQFPEWVLVDEFALYIVFENDVYKYALDGDGDLVPSEIMSGSASANYPNGIVWPAVAGGEFFFQDDTNGQLVWASPEGFVVADDSSGLVLGYDFQDRGFKLDYSEPAVIDDVLYFIHLDRMVAWDYQANRLFPAMEINAPSASYDTSARGIHAFGSNLILSARTSKGREPVVVNTLDDSVRVLDIDTSDWSDNIVDAEQFEGYFYHFVTTPESDVCYLLRGSGQTVTVVRDANQLPIRYQCWADEMSVGNMLEQFGEDLYFLAYPNSQTNLLEDPTEPGARLWRLASGQTVPELVSWANPPSINTGAVLSGTNSIGSSDFYIRFDSPVTNSVWYFDPEADSPSVQPVTNSGGINIYSAVENGLVPMADSYFGITNRQDPLSVDRKLFRITESGVALDPVKTFKDFADGSQPMEFYGSDEREEFAENVRFLDIAATRLPNVSFALIEGWYKDASYTGWYGDSPQFARAVARVERKEAGIEIELIAVPASGYFIESFSYINEGPDGTPYLLISFWTDGDGEDDGRIAYIELNPTESGSGALFNPSGVALDLDFANVLTRNGDPLNTMRHHEYVEDAGLIFTQASAADANDGYFYAIMVFEDHDFTELRVLADQMSETDDLYLGNETYLDPFNYYYVQDSYFHAAGDYIYITARDKGDDAHTYRYDPYATTIGYNTTSPIYTTLVADGLFGEQVLPRPSGSAHNAALDPNYLGGPARQVMRSATAANLNGSAFTRSGYTLSGWATSPNGSVVYQPNGSYPFTQSDILYAVWQQQTTVVTVPVPVAPGNSRVSFSAGEGVSQPAAQDVKTGELVRLPRVTKPGYEFLGWSEASTGLLFTEGYRPADSITLVARFQPMTVKIFLAPQTGIEMPVSVTYTSGQKLDLPKPTKKDYTFVGWVNAETGQRITSEWLPTESVMLAPLFRAGSADEVINFWRNSKFVSNTQLRKLSALVADEALISGRRTIVIRGFDIRNKDLARGRALSVAIKLRKLGVTDKIVLETELGGSANKAEVFVN